MQLRSNVSLGEGHKNLRRIIREIGDAPVDWNEANTRLHIIDRILVECLGWPKVPDRFVIEKHTDGEFQDYVLGSPASVIWEAKRSGAYFEFPADVEKKRSNQFKKSSPSARRRKLPCGRCRHIATTRASS